MLTGLDHLVIAVPELEAAVQRYTSLGFTVTPGGRHPGIGTHNALIAFEDGAYLELIAFYEPRPDHRWWRPLEQGGGLVDFCVRSDDLAADVAALRRAGIAMGAPEARERRRPDGYEARWTFALPQGPHRGVAPFIITDVTPRDERVPRQRRHANGATGIAALTVAVDDLPRVRGWYASLLGQPGQALARPALGAAGVGFAIGPHAIELLAPGGSGGPLAAWLRTRGPSPYAATLAAPAGPGWSLAESLTCGARLALIP